MKAVSQVQSPSNDSPGPVSPEQAGYESGEGSGHEGSGSESDSEYIPSYIQRKTPNTSRYVPRPLKKRLISKTRTKKFLKTVSRPPPQSTMRVRWRDEINALSDDDLKTWPCCSKQCFRAVNTGFLMDKMRVYRSIDKEARRLILFQMTCSDGTFHFDGVSVCSNFLDKALRFSRHMQSLMRRSSFDIESSFSDSLLQALNSKSCNVDDDELDVANKETPGSLGRELAKDSIIVFLRRVADATGEEMPDTKEVHLPFFKKEALFEVFEFEFNRINNSVSAPSLGYFLRMWGKYCSHIKVRKSRRFKECDICLQLRMEIGDAIKSGRSTDELKKQKQAHNDFIARERQYYTEKKHLACLKRSKYLSFAIDGADQSAFTLPHLLGSSKDDRGHGMKLHLIGLLQHLVDNHLHQK